MSIKERLETIRGLLRDNYPDMVGDPESIPHDIDQEAQKALAELANGEEPKPVGQPGEKRDTYYDPITQEFHEGEATLVEFDELVGYWEGHPLERWIVRFPGDSAKYERYILMQ
jgi:hypothetical protein